MWVLAVLIFKLLEQYISIRHLLVEINLVRQYGTAQFLMELTMDGK